MQFSSISIKTKMCVGLDEQQINIGKQLHLE